MCLIRCLLLDEMISSVEKSLSAMRATRETEQWHDDTHSRGGIVDLAIQPNLSIVTNLRKLRWIDGGVAQGWRGNRDSVRDKATRVDLIHHPLLSKPSIFCGQLTIHEVDSRVANRRTGSTLRTRSRREESSGASSNASESSSGSLQSKQTLL